MLYEWWCDVIERHFDSFASELEHSDCDYECDYDYVETYEGTHHYSYLPLWTIFLPVQNGMDSENLHVKRAIQTWKQSCWSQSSFHRRCVRVNIAYCTVSWDYDLPGLSVNHRNWMTLNAVISIRAQSLSSMNAVCMKLMTHGSVYGYGRETTRHLQALNTIYYALPLVEW